ncbi:unnamed protein product [Alopecurus aequalis]
MEEAAAGIAPRRSALLHPQIQSSEQSAGVACHRSTRLRPQIHATEEGAGVASPAAAASLPGADDILQEILLRLPPQPSSLPRASAVCKGWLALATDPKFHRRFRAHHRRAPPLLGFFSRSNHGIEFNPILDPPDRIPPQRFSRYSSCWDYDVLDCRHGLLLLLKNESDNREVIVCDPITSEERRLAIPPELTTQLLGGAVLRAASDDLGGCHSSPFRVVLVFLGSKSEIGDLACVYSSQTGVWGDLIFTGSPCADFSKPALLLGNRLYWLSLVDGIVELDLDEDSLTVIGVPPATSHFLEYKENCQIIQAEDGAVGLAILSYPRFQFWKRNVDAHGVATWMPWKSFEMHTIPGLPPQTEGVIAWLLWYDEDTDVIFLHARGSVYDVQLKLMRSRKLYETHYFNDYRPFKSFYTPGITIAGEFNGAEILHGAIG